MRLAGRVLTRGADGTDMPDGIKPPKRGPATEPLQLSTVFRGVQVLQTAITGLPIVEQRGGRDLPDVSPMVLQPDVSRSRRDFIADIVASLVLDGNAFTRIVRDWKGEIVTCEMLPPQYVTVTDESDDPARPDLRFSYLGHAYTADDDVHSKFLNVPGRLPATSSSLYAKNLFAFVETLIDKAEKKLAVNWEDELVKATCLTKDGAVIHPNFVAKA